MAEFHTLQCFDNEHWLGNTISSVKFLSPVTSIFKDTLCIEIQLNKPVNIDVHLKVNARNHFTAGFFSTGTVLPEECTKSRTKLECRNCSKSIIIVESD